MDLIRVPPLNSNTVAVGSQCRCWRVYSSWSSILWSLRARCSIGSSSISLALPATKAMQRGSNQLEELCPLPFSKGPYPECLLSLSQWSCSADRASSDCCIVIGIRLRWSWSPRTCYQNFYWTRMFTAQSRYSHGYLQALAFDTVRMDSSMLAIFKVDTIKDRPTVSPCPV